MRHDPASGAIVIMLGELNMHGMAQAVAELAEQGSPVFEAAQPMLLQLLKTETTEREVRSMAYQLKLAHFPAYRDLAGLDFAHGEVNEALVRQLISSWTNRTNPETHCMPSAPPISGLVTQARSCRIRSSSACEPPAALTNSCA